MCESVSGCVDRCVLHGDNPSVYFVLVTKYRAMTHTPYLEVDVDNFTEGEPKAHLRHTRMAHKCVNYMYMHEHEHEHEHMRKHAI